MSKGLPRSLAHANTSVLTINSYAIDHTMSFTGASGSADDATVVIGGLPEGNILFLGAVSYLTLTGPTSADLADDFQGDYSIGTAPNTDDELMFLTDSDIIVGTPIAAATAEVSPKTRSTTNHDAVDLGLLSKIFDNTDGSIELNLNVLLDDGEITNLASVDITAKGVLHIAFAIMGDD